MTFTNYYKDKIKKIFHDEFKDKVHLAVRVNKITYKKHFRKPEEKNVTLEFGLYDGKNLIISFGTVTVDENYTVTLENSPHLKIDIDEWIHFI